VAIVGIQGGEFALHLLIVVVVLVEQVEVLLHDVLWSRVGDSFADRLLLGACAQIVPIAQVPFADDVAAAVIAVRAHIVVDGVAVVHGVVVVDGVVVDVVVVVEVVLLVLGEAGFIEAALPVAHPHDRPALRVGQCSLAAPLAARELWHFEAVAVVQLGHVEPDAHVARRAERVRLRDLGVALVPAVGPQLEPVARLVDVAHPVDAEAAAARLRIMIAPPELAVDREDAVIFAEPAAHAHVAVDVPEAARRS
uniref:Uncharacterized protein n=1 Tax=Anopheles atroparvus TaxID=41427 RepID=A0AAG5D4A8_ANOAO